MKTRAQITTNFALKMETKQRRGIFRKLLTFVFGGKTSYKVYAFFMLRKTYKMSFRCDSANSSATEKFRCEIETEHKLNQRLHDLISSVEL